jgi:hypothetical protein
MQKDKIKIKAETRENKKLKAKFSPKGATLSDQIKAEKTSRGYVRRNKL